MRRAVAIAIVMGLAGCADNSGGPVVAPAPAEAPTAEASAKAAPPPGSRAARSAVSARPGAPADAMKTGMP